MDDDVNAAACHVKVAVTLCSRARCLSLVYMQISQLWVGTSTLPQVLSAAAPKFTDSEQSCSSLPVPRRLA